MRLEKISVRRHYDEDSLLHLYGEQIISRIISLFAGYDGILPSREENELNSIKQRFESEG